MKFRVGDRVRILSDDLPPREGAGSSPGHVGKLGTIAMILDDQLCVIDVNDGKSTTHWPHNLKLVRRKK